MAKTIVEGVASLRTFRNRGRPGRVDGTREFVFAPLPFVAVYEVHEEVYVPRILHGAQRWLESRRAFDRAAVASLLPQSQEWVSTRRSPRR